MVEMLASAVRPVQGQKEEACMCPCKKQHGEATLYVHGEKVGYTHCGVGEGCLGKWPTQTLV